MAAPAQLPAAVSTAALQAGWGGGMPPELGANMYDREIGSTGLRQFGGWIREEFLLQLQGRQAARVYREMLDNSPTVGAIMFAINGIMRKVQWRTNPANDSPQAEEMADFAESLRFDMSSTWEDTVTEALSMLGYGFAPMEIVYKRRSGKKVPKGIARSEFDDGRIGLRRLSIRGQDTILKWFFGDSGQILGLTQQPYIGPIIDIPIQKILLFRASQHKNNPEGRALDPETLIPTPNGWRRLDDLTPGSQVFDEEGRVRYVTGRADWNDRPSYCVSFSDGSQITADANHQWVVNWAKHPATPRLMTTEELADSRLLTAQGGALFSIKRAPALDYPEQHLLVDPYVLGIWLGDGSATDGTIACDAKDFEEMKIHFLGAGYSGPERRVGGCVLFTPSGTAKWSRDGLRSRLHALGLLGKKAIPPAYLRASIAQRLALLQGLMDSDGHITKTGTCDFTNTDHALALGVAELVRSLGVEARVIKVEPPTATEDYGPNTIARRRPIWRVNFTPDIPAFRLKRKAARLRTERTRNRHYIRSAVPVPARRTVCIEVDSPSHLFLAGEGMIPTHNSILRTAYTPYYYIKRMQEQEAVLFERLSGLPVMRVPNDMLERAAGGDANAQRQLAAYTKIVKNVRIDEQMGVILPSNTYMTPNGPSSVPMFDFKLETPQSGKSTLDANTPIIRYKNDIMTSILADFLEMGHSARGAQNLAETKVDIFMQSTEGWLNSMAAVLNRHMLPRIWELNGLDPDLMPEMVPDMAQRIDLDGLSNFILRMSQAGMPLFPDQDLESWVRDTAGMPDVGEDAGFAADMTAQAGEDPEAQLAKRDRMKSALSTALARRLFKSGRTYESQRPFRVGKEITHMPAGSPAGGQFAPGPHEARPSSAHLVGAPADRSLWPEHAQALKLPPAWTGVKISYDPKAALQAIGRDAKGRAQYVYSEAFASSQAAAKFARVEAMAAEYSRIEAQNLHNMAGDAAKAEHAECAALVMGMGLRPGSEADTSAAVKSFGATTLEGRHVVSEGGSTFLRFVGKKGVNINLEVTDKGMAGLLTRRAEAAGPGGQIFPRVSGSSLSDYVHTLGSGSFKTKDFRTLLGTRTAISEVEKMPVPTSEKAFKSSAMSVAKVVSSKLGNTPSMALKAYINPAVFSRWEQAQVHKSNRPFSDVFGFDVWFGSVDPSRKPDPLGLDPGVDDDVHPIKTPDDVKLMLGFDPDDLEPGSPGGKGSGL